MTGMSNPRSSWTAGAIRPPTNPTVLSRVAQLTKIFPVVDDHRAALQQLGSQIVYAAPLQQSGIDRDWIAKVRFSGAIESAFGLTREVMFLYSPYPSLQVREVRAVKREATKADHETASDVVFVWSPDDSVRQKLADWSSSSGTLCIPLNHIDRADPVSLIETLREFIYARDLFYEASPVRGDRFFGRRQLLRALADDVASRRVAGLFGLRKAGKTSVLTELSRILDTENTVILLRDLESLPSPPEDPVPSLLKDLASDIALVLEAKHFSSAKLKAFDSRDISAFRRALQATLRKLGDKGGSLVLILDEIEYLTPADRIDIAEGDLASVAQLLGALRSLVQENPNFTFLLSGLTSAIIESGRLYGRPNPLFSWAKPHFLSPFDRTEADELATSLSNRMGIDIEESALQTLFEATGGHAFLYRSLASAVVRTLPVAVFQRRVSGRDVLYALGSWKLSIAGNIAEMLDHVRRYYPTESILMDLLRDEPDEFDSLATDYPSATHHLVSLGLVRNEGGHFEMDTVLTLI